MDLTNFTSEEAKILLDAAIAPFLKEMLELIYENCSKGISVTRFDYPVDDYIIDKIRRKGFIVLVDTSTDEMFFTVQIRDK